MKLTILVGADIIATCSAAKVPGEPLHIVVRFPWWFPASVRITIDG